MQHRPKYPLRSFLHTYVKIGKAGHDVEGEKGLCRIGVKSTMRSNKSPQQDSPWKETENAIQHTSATTHYNVILKRSHVIVLSVCFRWRDDQLYMEVQSKNAAKVVLQGGEEISQNRESWSVTRTMSASAALEQARQQNLNPKPVAAAKRMISLKKMKRSQATMGSSSFDMSDFAKASQQVEKSIAFPSISWDFDDSESDDISFEPASKRRCSGLVRSKTSADLSTYFESNRCGSSGSLC
eukprot:scaffold3515_cov126-Cylindrotheca_fusiformis.AAC.38